MKGEIRGLRAGSYQSKDGSFELRVSKTDSGVMVELIDFDADIFYAFTLDNKVVKSEFGDPKTLGEKHGAD